MIDELNLEPGLSPVSPIILSLFGAFQFSVAGQPSVKFRTTKSRALLAYLVMMRGQPVLRSTLLDLLWHGYEKKSAQANLRQVLASLREVFAAYPLLHTDYYTVQLQTDKAILACDVLTFDDLLNAGQEHPQCATAPCARCQQRLQQAVALYKGEFLKEWTPVDSPPFEAWRQEQRQHYAKRIAHISALLKQGATHARKRQGNLVTALTPLLGRAQEVATLAKRLQQPVDRCLTLVGPGGIGKTRLALALGAQVADAFPDGVWFVDLGVLAPMSPANTPGTLESVEGTPRAGQVHDKLATAILQGQGISLQSTAPPTTQLLTYLQDKAQLLILDNFEHLSAGADLLPQLLQAAPALRLLITSRHHLVLAGQQSYSVAGLPWPPATAAALPPHELLAQYASIQLFLERAALTLVQLPLNAATLAAIVEICQVLEGVPLGLELAAGLLETHEISAIAKLIGANYQILQSSFLDLPPRQRSAQAVLHTAWQLLTPREALTLARCAVFQGGFTLAAAHTIAEATAADLEALNRKSLVQSISVAPEAAPGTGRYRMHELVRQFAADQLAQNGPLAQQTRHNHATYYLTLVGQWQPEEAAEQAFRTTMQTEQENVEMAWGWALASDQIALLLPAVAGLVEFYEMIGAFYAAEALLAHSVAQIRLCLATAANTGQLDTNEQTVLQQVNTLPMLLATLLMYQGYVYAVGLAQLAQAQAAATEALALAHTLEDARLVVRSYHVMAAIAYAEDNFAHGQLLGEKAIALAQQHALQREAALCLSVTGLIASARQDYATALPYITQALEQAQAAHDTRKVLLYRNQLGITYREMDDLSQALTCFEQNLPATRQSNDTYNIALANANIGLLRLLLGDYTAAAVALEEGYERFSALGEKRLMTDCLAIRGHLLLQQGDYEGAAATCRHTLAQPYTQTTAQRVAGMALGDLHCAQGEWADAYAAYTQVLAISQGADDPLSIRLLAQCGLAAVLLGQGQMAAARSSLEEILPLFDPAQFDTFFSAQRFLLPAYQILAATQDPRAQAILQQAWQTTMNVAQQFSNPDLRHSFLTNVTIHRRLQELLAAQTDES